MSFVDLLSRQRSAATPPAPTQRMRDLIAAMDAGFTRGEDLLNELTRLEFVLELPLTEPSDSDVIGGVE